MGLFVFLMGPPEHNKVKAVKQPSKQGLDGQGARTALSADGSKRDSRTRLSALRIGRQSVSHGAGGAENVGDSRLTRRRFVSKLGRSLAAALAFSGAAPVIAARNVPGRGSPSRKKIAIIATEIRRHSHAQHFVDRFLEGYGWEGRHYHPSVQVAGLYVDQFPEGDLTRDRVRRFGLNLVPTVAEALTLGTSRLAVDGVVIIGEHGRYPRNPKGQTLYPRYAWFKEVTKIFRDSGRVVPVFNDKHLSTDWDQAREMVDESKRLGFPFMAGSSLPVTWRIPAVDVPAGAALRESVSICYGGLDSYDFHGLETAQCMSERRAGGETGLSQLQALRGKKIWERVRQSPRTRELLFTALARSHSCRPPPGYTFAPPSVDWIEEASPGAVAYFMEHRDGFRTTMFLLNGLVSDFTYAGWIDRPAGILSCQMHLPMPLSISTTADFFNPLIHHIERMILTGKTPYPVARTLLTSGMTLVAMDSLFRGEAALATPELSVAYQASPRSTFWRS